MFHHALKQTLFIFSIVFVFSMFSTTVVFAGTSNNVVGRAWSSNIGWISMNNCSNPADLSTCSGPDYGVTASTTAPGTLSGYAWSSNLGWITFNPSSDCPSGFSQCTPYIDWANPNGDGSVNVKGWARVCSYYKTGCSGEVASNTALGGWDGWIALGDTNTSDTNVWGVTVSGNTMSGFAWGGDVIGWISFATGITINPMSAPSGTLVADDCGITAGNDSCTTSYRWTTQNLIVGASTAITRSDGLANYIPTPLNAGTNTATIKYGSTTFYLYHNAAEPPLANDPANASCVWDTKWVTNKCVALPTVIFSASDYNINVGESTLLRWTSTNAESCSSSDFNTGGAENNPSGVSVSPATTTTYSIECSNTAGTAKGSVTIIVNSAASPECSDGVDNADPEDAASPLWDANDPGCLSGPGGSYNPSDTSEVDKRKPIWKEF